MESFLSALYMIFWFIVALGILVFAHELGHFLMARVNGMRVESFAIGIGHRLFGWNKVTGFSFGPLSDDLDLEDNCDYKISAFPIGGSCKVSGMIDEAFDTEFAGQEPQPWEFRSKKPFQKALVISGGVIFNILLAILFFSLVTWNKGDTTYKTTEIGAVLENSIGSYCGLKAGDKVLSINNSRPEHWKQLLQALTIDNLAEDIYIKINRNGVDTTLFVNGKELTDKIASESKLGIEPYRKVVVADVMNGLAKENGININDTIIAVNSVPVFSLSDFKNKLEEQKNNHITLSIKNTTGIEEKSFQLDETATIGVNITPCFTGEIIYTEYNFLESFAKGTTQTFEMLGIIIVSLKQIITGKMKVKNAVGGPVMIAKQATQFAEQGIFDFLYFTGMLSLSLALINFLPFPALDGGHLIIIIVEAITRKEIPVKAKLIMQQFGMAALVLLMVYVIYNDVLKVF